MLAINLLEHLLQFEPNRRYDAITAMQHPYFTAAPIAPPAIPASVSSSTASLALPPRVAARASQASAAVAQQQQQQQQQQLLAQQQQQQMAQQQMMLEQQARQQQAAQGYYGQSRLGRSRGLLMKKEQIQLRLRLKRRCRWLKRNSKRRMWVILSL
jgi:negative regulator of PHO system